MIKRTPNNGIFILAKSNNWYLTLAYQKQRLYIVCILLTLLQNVVRAKEMWCKTNEKDLVQTVGEWVRRASHYSGASWYKTTFAKATIVARRT